jgi:uncharacterized protein YigA (DUF484 family)
MKESINRNSIDEALGIYEAIEATQLLLAMQWEETNSNENEQERIKEKKRIFRAQDELSDLISRVQRVLRGELNHV